MKKKLLHIVTLLFFSLACVHFMFSTLFTGDAIKLLPLKISPRIPQEHYAPQPQQKNKYSPKDLRRIYLFEHIHRSVERGKKGIVC